jgi:hypothetical protein
MAATMRFLLWGASTLTVTAVIGVDIIFVPEVSVDLEFDVEA